MSDEINENELYDPNKINNDPYSDSEYDSDNPNDNYNLANSNGEDSEEDSDDDIIVDYPSPISSKTLNIINVLLSFILLFIKVIITYNFLNKHATHNMFNILTMIILFYYSFSTLGWSNRRLRAINKIGITLFDKFIEHWSVIVADILIIVVIYITRHKSELINHSGVVKVLVGLMCMRIIIQIYRISERIKKAQNTNEDNSKKILIDDILVMITKYLI